MNLTVATSVSVNPSPAAICRRILAGGHYGYNDSSTPQQGIKNGMVSEGIKELRWI